MNHGIAIRSVGGRAANDVDISRIAPGAERQKSMVILNADDWGRDCVTTDRTLECFRAGVISSVSAMVFMGDSERAAEIAQMHSIDAGLHLNFTLEYSAARGHSRLLDHQREIARALTSHRFAATLYYPRLTASFEYVVKVQLEEFERIYGAAPMRLDGHHHMHLCANVMCQSLLPNGAIVRRNLSFDPGEKPFPNRLYRRMQDQRLSKRHRLADYFFDLHPVEPSERLRRIFELGSRANVEIETHPVRDEEYAFLMSEEFQKRTTETSVASGYILYTRGSHQNRKSLA